MEGLLENNVEFRIKDAKLAGEHLFYLYHSDIKR